MQRRTERVSPSPGGVFTARMSLIGDHDTGKSALLHRVTRGAFSERSHPTIGLDYASMVVDTPDPDPDRRAARYRLQMWDTAGQERFRALCATYIRQSHVLWLCIASNNMESFFSARDYWWPRVVQERGHVDAVCVVVLTKTDVACDKVRDAVAQWVAEHPGLGQDVLETSARTGAGVEEACRWTADACHRAACWQPPRPPPAPAAARRCCPIL